MNYLYVFITIIALVPQMVYAMTLDGEELKVVLATPSTSLIVGADRGHRLSFSLDNDNLELLKVPSFDLQPLLAKGYHLSKHPSFQNALSNKTSEIILEATDLRIRDTYLPKSKQEPYIKQFTLKSPCTMTALNKVTFTLADNDIFYINGTLDFANNTTNGLFTLGGVSQATFIFNEVAFE